MVTGRRKILIVDDDPAVLLTTAALLEEVGYEVVKRQTALGTSGAALRERPDLILLDISMPGLSGGQLAHLLAEHPRIRPIPIVLHSGAEPVTLRRLVAETGAAAYVQKGGPERDLFDTIAAALGDSNA